MTDRRSITHALLDIRGVWLPRDQKTWDDDSNRQMAVVKGGEDGLPVGVGVGALPDTASTAADIGVRVGVDIDNAGVGVGVFFEANALEAAVAVGVGVDTNDVGVGVGVL